MPTPPLAWPTSTSVWRKPTSGHGRFGPTRRKNEGEAFTRDDVAAALGEFGATWDVLCPREQAAVLANLVKRVDYDGAKKTVAITFHPAGLTTLGQAPIEHEEVA